MKGFEKRFPSECRKQLWPPGLVTKAVPWRNFCTQSDFSLLLDSGCTSLAFVFPRHAGEIRSQIDELMLEREQHWSTIQTENDAEDDAGNCKGNEIVAGDRVP